MRPSPKAGAIEDPLRLVEEQGKPSVWQPPTPGAGLKRTC
jgi:hypothetical protein